jgi:hypothetical protein
MSSFMDLDFIDQNALWTPIVTGNKRADYEYGYNCAYQYSEAIIKAMTNGSDENLNRKNETFRQSIDYNSPAGMGFRDAIMGRPNRYKSSEIANDD